MFQSFIMWILWLLSHVMLGTLYLDLTQVSVRVLEVELGIMTLQHVFKVMKGLQYFAHFIYFAWNFTTKIGFCCNLMSFQLITWPTNVKHSSQL